MPDITIMSGDGVFEKSWYKGAGDAANGTLLTFGGVGPDQLTGAGKTWFDEYMAAHNGDSPATYTAYGNAARRRARRAEDRSDPNDRYEVLKAAIATKDLTPSSARRPSTPTATPSAFPSAATRSRRRGPRRSRDRSRHEVILRRSSKAGVFFRARPCPIRQRPPYEGIDRRVRDRCSAILRVPDLPGRRRHGLRRRVHPDR